MDRDWHDIPGGDLVSRGLEDLRAGKLSAEGLLVAIGGPRLRRLGIPVPTSKRRSTDSTTYWHSATPMRPIRSTMP